MEERLLQFLDSEQLSSAKFADVIGVQRSSVSHILSGRNKPSFDFLQKTLLAFPHLNAEWLILGKGSIYGEENKTFGNLFKQGIRDADRNADDKVKDHSTSENIKSVDKESAQSSNNHSNPIEKSEDVDVTQNSTKTGNDMETKSISAMQGNISRVIKRVILLYTDNSFESFETGH